MQETNKTQTSLYMYSVLMQLICNYNKNCHAWEIEHHLIVFVGNLESDLKLKSCWNYLELWLPKCLVHKALSKVCLNIVYPVLGSYLSPTYGVKGQFNNIPCMAYNFSQCWPKGKCLGWKGSGVVNMCVD